MVLYRFQRISQEKIKAIVLPDAASKSCGQMKEQQKSRSGTQTSGKKQSARRKSKKHTKIEGKILLWMFSCNCFSLVAILKEQRIALQTLGLEDCLQHAFSSFSSQLRSQSSQIQTTKNSSCTCSVFDFSKDSLSFLFTLLLSSVVVLCCSISLFSTLLFIPCLTPDPVSVLSLPSSCSSRRREHTLPVPRIQLYILHEGFISNSLTFVLLSFCYWFIVKPSLNCSLLRRYR